MSKFKIDEISIKNFRGFKKETVFKFDNDYNAIIVSGMNGIGKTSLYDAIEWAFTGELIRYSESGDEKNCKFINFQPSEDNELAKVSIVLKNEEISFTIIRELSKMRKSTVSDYGSKKTKLIVVLLGGEKLYEKQAEEFIDENLINTLWKGKIKFKEVFGQYHLLSQDKIKYFVQGIKMPDRYEYFANLLGNERYLKIIPKLREKEILINSKLEEVSKNIDIVNQKIAILSNSNITNINLDTFNIKGTESALLDAIKEICNISEAYNLNYNLNLDKKDISIKGIENLNKSILKIYTYLEQVKNENLKELDELNELKIGYCKFIKDLNDDKKYKLLLEYYNRIEKLKYIKSNKEQYKIYEKNKLDKINKKKTIQSEINILEQRRNFIKSIYSQLWSHYTELNQKTLEETNVGKFIRLIENNKINFTQGDIYIYIDDKKKLEIKLSNDNSKTSLENIYLIFKENIHRKILDLQKQYIELNKLHNSNKTERINIQNQIKNLSDMDKDLKNVLIEAKNYIQRQKGTSCPICDSVIGYKTIVGKIDEKLNNSNLIIEELNKNLGYLDVNITCNDINLGNKAKSIMDCITEYTKFIIELTQIIDEEVFKMGNVISLKRKNIQSIDLELDTLEKLNDKYTIIKKEFNIKNIDIDIDMHIKVNKNYIADLGFDYGKNKIDEISRFKYNNDLNIKLYTEKIKGKSIDIKNIYKYIETSIEKENKEKTLLEERLNRVRKIKEEIKVIYVCLKENEDYKNLQEYTKKLKMLEVSRITYKNKIKDIDKLKLAITDVVSKLNQEVMEDNKNMINSIFRKIFPNPYYKELDFIFDKNRNKDILKLQCKHTNDDTTINPAYIFSSTQINIISVSVFLGISIKQNCTNLDLILLDDPVQNMDDMNVLSFIDVLRSCIDQKVLDKQIIISTHDERVSNLFIKKFRFFNTKIYKFIEYTSEGPKVVSKELNGQLKL